jgi:hypothetical protein
VVHFLLLGAVLFAAYHYVQPDRGAAPSSKQIQLTLDELAQLALVFRSQWRREPTPEEFSRLVESKVQERFSTGRRWRWASTKRRDRQAPDGAEDAVPR